MNQTQAARILEAMARMEPEYDTLAAEYQNMLSGAVLPVDFPEQALNLFRENPDTAAQIDRYEENLSHMQSYGAADWLSPQIVLSVMVLLSVHFHIRRDKNGKWTFEAGFQPLKAEGLKPVCSVLAAVIGKAGEGLTEIAETMGGQQNT